MKMSAEFSPKMFEYIVESLPMPVLFCDTGHVIRYLNKAAKYHYYEARPHPDLIGRNIQLCHKPETWDIVLKLYEQMKNEDLSEARVGTSRPEGYRIYMTAVRDENGELVGYLQRFEDGKHV